MDIQVVKPRRRKVEVIPKSRPPSDQIDSLGTPRKELMESWPVKCAYVVNEILSTELVYIEALEEIMKGYKNPLAGHLGSSSDSHQLLRTIFCNIEELYHLHFVLFAELKACDTDPDGFGRVFTCKREDFVLYTEYCTNYDLARACLQRQTQNDKDFENFVKSCQAQLEHDLPLSHQLIKPVQRITKYHLLLREVLKGFDPNRHGYLSLSSARDTMVAIAGRINEVKKQKENRERVRDLQTSMVGWKADNLSAYGELVLEGSFKVGRRGAERQVLLFEKLLLILKKKEAKRYNYKGHLLFSELCVEPESRVGESSSFKVFSKLHRAQSYEIHTMGVRLQKEWVERITALSQRKTSPLHPVPLDGGEESEAKRRKLEQIQQTTGLPQPRRATPTKQDHRYHYGSSHTRRVMERASSKRGRTDVRSLFVDSTSPAELKSIRHTYTEGLMESSFDAIYEEESVVPETSAYVLKTTPEERTAPYEVPRSLSTSQSSDSLLDLNDVEFGFERGSNEEWGEEGGEFPTMSYHLEDIDEVDYAGEEEEEEGEGEGKKERLRKVASQRVCVRKPSQLQRKAAIRVKKARLSSPGMSPSSSFSSLIKLRAQDVREASKSPRHTTTTSVSEELKELQARLLSEEEKLDREGLPPSAVVGSEDVAHSNEEEEEEGGEVSRVGGSSEQVEYDSMFESTQGSYGVRSSADEESYLMESGASSLQNGLRDGAEDALIPTDVTDSGLPPDTQPLGKPDKRSRQPSLEESNGTPFVTLSEDFGYSEVVDEFPLLGPGVEIDSDYFSSQRETVEAEGGEGGEGGEDDFVILNDDSSSESDVEDLDNSDEGVVSFIDEVGGSDIIPPPTLFAELGHQEVPMATQGLSQSDVAESLVSRSAATDSLRPSQLQLSPPETREERVDLSDKSATDSSTDTAEDRSDLELYGTLPRVRHIPPPSPQRRPGSAKTPTRLLDASKKLSTSTATLSRVRQQGFSRLLEFTKQQSTPPRPKLDLSQSLPVGTLSEVYRREVSPLLSEDEVTGFEEGEMEETAFAKEGGGKVGKDCKEDNESESGVPCEVEGVSQDIQSSKEEVCEVPYTLIEGTEEDNGGMADTGMDAYKGTDDQLQIPVLPSEANTQESTTDHEESSVSLAAKTAEQVSEEMVKAEDLQELGHTPPYQLEGSVLPDQPLGEPEQGLEVGQLVQSTEETTSKDATLPLCDREVASETESETKDHESSETRLPNTVNSPPPPQETHPVPQQEPSTNDSKQEDDTNQSVRKRPPYTTTTTAVNSTHKTSEMLETDRGSEDLTLLQVQAGGSPGILGYLTRLRDLRRFVRLPSLGSGLIMLGVATIASLVFYTLSGW